MREGIRLFNDEQFFECHEVLEEAWLDATGSQKTILQGLIQVAVAFYHLRRENFVGARRLLAAGLEKLSAFVTDRSEIDVSGLLETLEPLRQQLDADQARQDWPAPQIRSVQLPQG
ncbi:MAG: DUF309 domain-containing protein [Acidobacteria bacterium]|nr:DUF309 domain-containing protein [Acidobacteriota bacterium]